MTELTFEVIELLARYVAAQLRRDYNEMPDTTLKAVIAERILQLDDRMAKLRHEHKGGA